MRGRLKASMSIGSDASSSITAPPNECGTALKNSDAEAQLSSSEWRQFSTRNRSSQTTYNYFPRPSIFCFLRVDGVWNMRTVLASRPAVVAMEAGLKSAGLVFFSSARVEEEAGSTP
jgi:hypothetical protein